eukprot:scaffold168428_cov68-Attheya_sp.AAC.1
MEDVIKCAVEIEAGRSQRLKESERVSGDIDQSLKQLVLNEEYVTERGVEEEEPTNGVHVKSIHPASIEKALSITCRMSPSSASSA